MAASVVKTNHTFLGSPALAFAAAWFAFLMTQTSPAIAQTSYKLEVFGGYAYSTQPPPFRFVEEVEQLPTKHLHGWKVSTTGYVTRRFGVELSLAGLSGSYASTDARAPGSPRVDPPIRHLSILAGPRFKVFAGRRWDVTVHALFGTSRVRRADPHGLSLPSTGTFTFGASVGGSIDLNLGEGVALRLVEPSIFRCSGRRECDETSFRVSSGFIFKFFGR
jgi:hypothetical protein